MSELTLLVLRIGFLLLLWLFIMAILYALRSDLFGAPARKLPNDAASKRLAPDAPVAPTPAPNTATAPPAPAETPTTPPVTPSGGALPSAAQLPTQATQSQPSPSGGALRTLVITSGTAAGTALPLDEDVITIGRSTDSTLAIVDEYTSSYHAKLARNGDQWLLTDLDSTNGTKLNGSRVQGTVLVPPFTPITIGTTTFELRP